MHLRQPGFTYSACRPFTKNRIRIPKFKATGDSRYIYSSEVGKIYFQHDMPYEDFKDLPRRMASDKELCDKAFEVASNSKNDGCQRGLVSTVYKFSDEKAGDTSTHTMDEIISEDQQLANKLQTHQ